MRSDLEALRRNNTLYFVICVAMTLVLFAISVTLVIRNLNDQNFVTATVTGLGVTSAGLITVMTRLWSTKTRTEFMMLLVTYTDGETLKTIINVLARRL